MSDRKEIKLNFSGFPAWVVFGFAIYGILDLGYRLFIH